MNDMQETASQMAEYHCGECGAVMYKMLSQDGKTYVVDRDILEWDPENMAYFTQCPICGKKYKAGYERFEGTPGYQLRMS